MGLNIRSGNTHINKEKIGKLWQLIAADYGYSEHIVTVQEVTKRKARDLNKQYRGKDKATNVLTFSYEEGEHDISLCLSLAKEEAKQRKIDYEEYIAMLLAHAFLHVVGMNHAESENEKKMKRAESRFLDKSGFGKKPL